MLVLSVIDGSKLSRMNYAFDTSIENFLLRVELLVSRSYPLSYHRLPVLFFWYERGMDVLRMLSARCGMALL